MNCLLMLTMLNLTEEIIAAFGLETMNRLWPIFYCIYDTLQSFMPNIDLSLYWNRFFA